MAAGSEHGEIVSLFIRRADVLAGRTALNDPAFVVYLNRGRPLLSQCRIDFVAEYLKLSQVEARFAVLLADGLTVDEIGVRLGVTRSSARTYCKRVLAKTSASRQVDLVRLVLTSLARLA